MNETNNLYVVSACKPSIVKDSIIGNFLGEENKQLIVNKISRIDIYSILGSSDLVDNAGKKNLSLKPLFEFPIYGRIADIFLIHLPSSILESQNISLPSNSTIQCLFIALESLEFSIVYWNSLKSRIETLTSGNLSSRPGRLSDIGLRIVYDSLNRMIGAHVYDGLLQIIPIHIQDETNTRIETRSIFSDSFNVRLDDLQVFDMVMLNGYTKPTIAVLSRDRNHRHVKTYSVNLMEKELIEGPWKLLNVDNTAHMLYSLPEEIKSPEGAMITSDFDIGGGVLVISESSITYINGSEKKSVALRHEILFRAIEPIDGNGNRFLLGDHNGQLYLLMILLENGKVNDLYLSVLGVTSIPSTLSYLNDGEVFVGSLFGNSQLVKLGNPSLPKESSGYYMQIIHEFPNLGPIVDFCVVDLELHGQSQVVTCSGGYKDGSLRVIKNGIGFNQEAILDLPGLKGIWTLKDPSTNFESYNNIVITFLDETRIFSIISPEEVKEAYIKDFKTDSVTLYSSVLNNGLLIQCVPKGLYLYDFMDNGCINYWTTEKHITLISTSDSSILLVLGNEIIHIEIENNEIIVKKQIELNCDISCIYLNSNNDQEEKLVYVGTWDFNIQVFKLDSFELLYTYKFVENVIPRSVLCCIFDNIKYLLVALGDGNVYNFVIKQDPNYELLNPKKITLGTKPPTLTTFEFHGNPYVFICSDRPTVLYGHNHKLRYSNVNLSSVEQVRPFNSSIFPNSFAVVDGSGTLIIGRIEEIQRLHIKTIPLGEMPRRIAYQKSSSSYMVLTERFDLDDKGMEHQTSIVRVLDSLTFNEIASMELNNWESVCSVLSTKLGDDDRDLYLVGTGISTPQESEPSNGRILIFSIIDGKLDLLDEVNTSGAVFSMCEFKGKLLAGVNSKIELFNWNNIDTDSMIVKRSLISETSHHGHVIALYLAVNGNTIIVGDLIKSVSFLNYGEKGIFQVARDYHSTWMSAVEAFNENFAIGGENSMNLITYRRVLEGKSEEEKGRLSIVGEYHLGGFVNKFRHGSLVMQEPNEEHPIVSDLLYATADGVIGVIYRIPDELFTILYQVQNALTTVIQGIGGFSHASYRSFKNESKTSPSKKFIDGDIIESFLDLPAENVEKVSEMVDITAEELTNIIEDLARLH